MHTRAASLFRIDRWEILQFPRGKIAREEAQRTLKLPVTRLPSSGSIGEAAEMKMSGVSSCTRGRRLFAPPLFTDLQAISRAYLTRREISTGISESWPITVGAHSAVGSSDGPDLARLSNVNISLIMIITSGRGKYVLS